MNVGKAITAGMRADRERDINRACWGHWGVEHMYRMQAWYWWGWSLELGASA